MLAQVVLVILQVFGRIVPVALERTTSVVWPRARAGAMIGLVGSEYGKRKRLGRVRLT